RNTSSGSGWVLPRVDSPNRKTLGIPKPSSTVRFISNLSRQKKPGESAGRLVRRLMDQLKRRDPSPAFFSARPRGGFAKIANFADDIFVILDFTNEELHD